MFTKQMYWKSTVFLLLMSFMNCSTEKAIYKSSKKTIETLASEEFAGRGYTHNGMEKAANYIAENYEKLGLEKVDNSYFQTFNYPINVIEKAELSIDGSPLKFGEDFLVNANAPSFKKSSNNIYQFDNEEFDSIDFYNEKQVNSYFQKLYYRYQRGGNVIVPPYDSNDVGKKEIHDSIVRVLARFNENILINKPQFFKVFHSFKKNKLTKDLSNYQNRHIEFMIDKKFYSNKIKKLDYKIESKFMESFQANNVIGKIEGENKDSTVLITAHYDHLGMVNDVYFPGSNDNASGVAFILSLAQHFSKQKPPYTLVFVAFAGEEAGLKGSQYFVENPLVDLSKIKFLLNFDIMGTGDDGIQIVNSKIYEKEYELLNKINNEQNLIKQIKRRGESCNSDHCPFYEKGVPSFFTYTLGGVSHYHNPYDKAETLPLTEFVDIQKLFVQFILLL